MNKKLTNTPQPPETNTNSTAGSTNSSFGSLSVKRRVEKSYFDYHPSALKSGIQKYARRNEVEKGLWCLVEMDLFSLLEWNGPVLNAFLARYPELNRKQVEINARRLRTNMVNRLVVMMTEEVNVSAWCMPAIIFVGIFGGFFAPVEAAAIAVLYAIVRTMLVYRTVTIRDMGPILVGAAITSAAVLVISGVALSFSYIVAIQHIPQRVLEVLLFLSDNIFVVMTLIIIVLLIAGMFVGRTANVLLFGPILIPIFYQFGYSPVHTGMILIIILGVGHLTPPVGGAILTACLIGRCTMPDIMKYMWPMIILEVALAVVILLVPALSEALPRFFELGGL